MLKLRADLCFSPKMYNIHSCKVNSSIEKEEKIAGSLLSACRACFHPGHGRGWERDADPPFHQRGDGAGCEAEGKAAWHNMTDQNDTWESWYMGCTWLWIGQGDAPSSDKKKWNYCPWDLTLISLNLILIPIIFKCWWWLWAPLSNLSKNLSLLSYVFLFDIQHIKHRRCSVTLVPHGKGRK